MDKNPTITSFLSLLVPGAGQLHCGSAKKGLFSLVAAIMIGNLNLSFILVFVLAKLDSSMGWAYWLSRNGRDIVVIWTLAFWAWALIDAFQTANGV